VPVEHGRRYVQHAGGSVDYHLLPGATHSFAPLAREDEVLSLTERWLVERLSPVCATG